MRFPRLMNTFRWLGAILVVYDWPGCQWQHIIIIITIERKELNNVTFVTKYQLK